jgi:CMP-N-acetylneuraminic acid synthetase
MANRNILLTVAARGGSKGVKNKNIREIAGKPLIAYTLRQAIKWGKASAIVCSTDSPDVAKIAARYGAEIPFMRPKNLSGDRVPKVSVIKHALLACEELHKRKYDIVVDLDVTSPLRRIKDLNNCLKLFNSKKPKTLFSVVNCHRSPYFNMVERLEDGTVNLCKSLKKPVFRRQDSPVVYDMNASIYFYDRSYLLTTKKMSAISDKSIAYVMDEISRIDVDSELDFAIIEFLIKKGVLKDDKLFG